MCTAALRLNALLIFFSIWGNILWGSWCLPLPIGTWGDASHYSLSDNLAHFFFWQYPHLMVKICHKGNSDQQQICFVSFRSCLLDFWCIPILTCRWNNRMLGWMLRSSQCVGCINLFQSIKLNCYHLAQFIGQGKHWSRGGNVMNEAAIFFGGSVRNSGSKQRSWFYAGLIKIQERKSRSQKESWDQNDGILPKLRCCICLVIKLNRCKLQHLNQNF